MSDLTTEDKATIAALLRDTIASDRFPMSPRIRGLRAILDKLEPPRPRPVLPPAEAARRAEHGCARMREHLPHHGHPTNETAITPPDNPSAAAAISRDANAAGEAAGLIVGPCPCATYRGRPARRGSAAGWRPSG